ncbi:MAG: hypothetical protein ACI8RZ_005330 [Myxococcota bacterium]|jgi:hypothetical protein
MTTNRCTLWSVMWMILACGVERDADLLLRLVSLETPSASIHLAQCRQLRSETLRGECQLVIAQRAAEASGAPPEQHCSQIDDATWQSECWFVAAEAHSESDPALAAVLCTRSGPFADHCSQHLWQQSIRRLTWKRGSDAFASELPDAKRIFDAWAPHLAADFDFEARLWRRFYEGGFERSGKIELSKCTALPQADEARCRTAGASLYGRRIQEIRHITRAMAELCRIPEPTSAAASATGVPELVVEPAIELDAVVVRALAEVCDAEGNPVPSDRRVMSPDGR